jgi:hypothetical protein
MIFTKDTLTAGTSFARLMLVMGHDNTFKVNLSDTGVIHSIFKTGGDDYDKDWLQFTYSDGHPLSTHLTGYVNDLVGHDDTVICVPLEMLEQYNTVDAFSSDAIEKVREETVNDRYSHDAMFLFDHEREQW